MKGEDALQKKRLVGVAFSDVVTRGVDMIRGRVVHVQEQSISGGFQIMAVITREDYVAPRVLDLGGPEGNAYVLLGIAHGLLEAQDMDPDMYIQMMKAGDYGNLVRLFNDLFGGHFTIVLPEGVERLEEL